ncbi:hypothetical protein K435DRAFT_860064 [Dendrothele bispora CBS 962.96]|uniref:CHAT domain-containing protein n=1 Tax=Dendrothele bispora (strain CBS 962.96) TaxID=1314807 RepID=A0A4S8LZZ3_DENBC|nr:hypothetical protein K435DRAFT_860064 [Dendrothele bispora CBS 962.96]
MDLTSQEHPSTETDLPGQQVSNEADDDAAMMSPSTATDVKDLDDLIQGVERCRQKLSLLSEESENRSLFEQTVVNLVMTPLESTQITSFTEIRDALRGDSSLLLKRMRDQASVLSQVALALKSRYERFGAMQDLEENLILFRSSLELDSNDAMIVTNYGVSLLMRFERRGKPDDLSAAITTQNQAVQLLQLLDDMDENLPSVLNNLGNALQMRFEHLGKVVDIDEAVNVHIRALYHRKLEEESKFIFHYSLGVAYHRRFEHLRDTTDLNSAIRAKRMAVTTMPEDHQLKAQYLASYGTILFQRYELSSYKSDLEKSIQLLQEALELTPSDHPARLIRLLNLAQMMRDRFLLTNTLQDIEKALFNAIELFQSLKNEYPLRQAACFLCLSEALRARHKVANSGDLDRSINTSRLALRALPIGPETAKFCNELGTSLLLRYHESNESAVSDLDEAIAAFEKGARHPSKPAKTQFLCATQWARTCSEGDIQAGVAAFKSVFELIPRLVWIGNGLHRRYEDTEEIRTVLSEAVALAIKAGELELALEWAEQGRCIVWSQVLQLRQPVNDAFGDAGELDSVASKLQNIGMESILPLFKGLPVGLLAALIQALMPKGEPSPIPGMSREEFSRRLVIFPVLLNDAKKENQRRLAEKYENLVAEAQLMPGNDRFLRPKRFSELHAAAKKGPVVFINVCTERCDAIAIVPWQEEAISIPLESFSEKLAEEMLEDFVGVLEEKGVRTKSRGPGMSTFTSRLRGILACLWNDVVRPIVLSLGEHLRPSDDGLLPHITWCTSGPLAFLPLHAAGIFEDKGSLVGQRVFDHVVSSYTTSISALLTAQNHNSESVPPTSAPRVLAVSQPKTPAHEDLKELPHTVEEVEILQGMLPHLTWLNDEEGTKDAVMKAIHEHEWVHFACHGALNMENPLQSSFLLQDGGLELVDLMKQSFTHTQLAYLSACRTAAGSEKFPEEAVHLAAGMLMAGFQNVVATLWSIDDKDAMLVAKHFYRYLKEEGGGDSSQASYALHHAVGKLRESIGDKHFTRWIPFIHFGV